MLITIASDISVLEIFLPLTTGARVYITQKTKEKEITMIGAGIFCAIERISLVIL
ncbi:hypothetical protein [Paenibacillus amylolyticus]|uniref:hypothetical protein n=1 Tax=Paenibacillus amylolyticus TaxID=1451 RepID=UPI00201DB625|nr:hypothetical protein [Paenibacillus amylolyticus]MCL6662970.1 hypothetical protein [Paenibacillus amylolyticus]